MSVSKFTLISLVLLHSVYGQNTPPIPGLPIPNNPRQNDEGPQEGLPAPTDLTRPIVVPQPNALVEGEMNFRSLDGFGVAALYTRLTGKRVLVSSAVQGVEIAFVQAAGLTNREAAELLEQTLLMEGLQINASNRNPNVVSLLAVTQPGGAASVVTPVRVIDDPANLALETGVVTYVMSFQFLKPEEAQRAFTQVYGQLRPGGTIAEVGNASSLIITEKASLIQTLLKIKEKIDVPSATVGTEWVDVRYADVEQLAEQLNGIFNAQASSEQSARVQRQGNNTPPIPGLNTGGAAANAAAGGATPGAGGGEESPPSILPDSRTNRILLIGRPVDLIFIKELIERWDIPSDQRNFLRRKLKFLPVSEFVSIAENAISRTLSDPSAAGGGASSSGLNAGDRGANNNNNNNNNNQNNAGGGQNSAASLPGSDRPTAPESVLVGRTLLVTDNVTNSIIAQGPPHHLEIVERLIGELDVKSEQVAISAVFGRYAVTDGLTFGVDVAKILNNNGIGFSTNNGGGGVVGRDSINAFANLISTGSQGGLALGGFTGNFGVFVNALESYTNFETFARPTIFTTNNKEARISSGTQIAIPTSTFQNGQVNGGQSTNIEFRDVALELLVRPLVNSPDEITLEISINRNTIGEDRPVGELEIPDLLSDQLETTVTVPVGSAVLLGGLIEETEMSNESGVPVLRSIPLLGKLFRNNDDELMRSELVIMIRPTIVDGSIQIEQYQQQYDQGSNISNQARQDFTSGPYRPRVNSAVERQAPPRRKAMSATQKGIENKKKRLRQKARGRK